MDPKEKERLKKKAELEERYGHLVNRVEEWEEVTPMKVSGASVRDIDRIAAKRKKEKK